VSRKIALAIDHRAACRSRGARSGCPRKLWRRFALSAACIGVLFGGAGAATAATRRHHHHRHHQRPLTYAFYRVEISLSGHGDYTRYDPSGERVQAEQHGFLSAHGTAHVKISRSGPDFSFDPVRIPSTGSVDAFTRNGWGFLYPMNAPGSSTAS
jgi:hypothetical protein